MKGGFGGAWKVRTGSVVEGESNASSLRPLARLETGSGDRERGMVPPAVSSAEKGIEERIPLPRFLGGGGDPFLPFVSWSPPLSAQSPIPLSIRQSGIYR